MSDDDTRDESLETDADTSSGVRRILLGALLMIAIAVAIFVTVKQLTGDLETSQMEERYQ